MSKIPLLGSSKDWPWWYAAVVEMVDNLGLFRHICREPHDGTPAHPACRPTYPPALPGNPLAGELEVYDTWWQDDGITRHILCSRLGPGPWSIVPLKRDSNGTPVSTARDVFCALHETYGGGDHSSAGELKDHLIVLRCGTTCDSVLQYVETWRSSLHQLERTEWDFTAFDLIRYFVRNLSNDEAFHHVRVAVSTGFAQDPPSYPPFETLVRVVLAADVEN